MNLLQSLKLTIWVLVVILACAPKSAAAVTINFDEVTLPRTGTRVLGMDHYANLGVRFVWTSEAGRSTGPTVVREPLYGNIATSDPNGVSFGYNGSVLEAIFVDAISHSLGVTNFVSFAVGDLSREADPMRVQAFDIRGNLLGTRNFTSQPNNQLGFNDFGVLSFAMAGIHRLVFSDGSRTGATMDDFRFNPVRGTGTPVPEPGSLLLVISGLIGAAARSRARQEGETQTR